MATTRIMPLHIGKGRTESQAISDIIDYVANPQKTDNGKLITGYGCDSRTADAEYNKVVKFSADELCRVENIGNDRVLIIGKLRPAHEQLVLAAVFRNVSMSRLCELLVRIERLCGDALCDVLVRHVGVIDANTQCLAQFFGQFHFTILRQTKFCSIVPHLPAYFKSVT